MSPLIWGNPLGPYLPVVRLREGVKAVGKQGHCARNPTGPDSLDGGHQLQYGTVIIGCRINLEADCLAVCSRTVDQEKDLQVRTTRKRKSDVSWFLRSCLAKI